MKQLAALLVLFCCLASATLAQNDPITILNNVVGPDTVTENDTESIIVSLRNDTTIPIFTGINLAIAVNGNSAALQTQPLADTLMPGDTADFTFTVTFSQANSFAPGGNIVLIWPEAPLFTGLDTLTHGIWVLEEQTGSGADSLGCQAYAPNQIPTTIFKDFDLFFEVVNRGQNIVNRSVKAYIATNNSIGQLTVIDSVGNITFNNEPFNGAVLGSIFSFEADKIQQFGDGGNVIVVWPESPPNASDPYVTTDSLWVNIEVAPVGIEGPESAYLDNVKVFPNPTTGMVYVRFLGGNEPIQRVTVTDINGRIVEQHGFTPEMDFSDYPAGYYFVEVEVDSGESRIFKMVRY